MLQSFMFIFAVCVSSQLEYNSLFDGLGGWDVRGSEQKIRLSSQWMITGMCSMFRVMCR